MDPRDYILRGSFDKMNTFTRLLQKKTKQIKSINFLNEEITKAK